MALNLNSPFSSPAFFLTLIAIISHLRLLCCLLHQTIAACIFISVLKFNPSLILPNILEFILGHISFNKLRKNLFWIEIDIDFKRIFTYFLCTARVVPAHVEFKDKRLSSAENAGRTLSLRYCYIKPKFTCSFIRGM